ncbi:tRNA-intron lyase [Sarracenia purpurea var. burkii]
MGPRWKGKGSEAKALADPMSKIVSQLQSTLTQSDSHGLLSGCSVLLQVETEQTELLSRACFGRPIITSQKDNQWFQLGLEEAFYLFYYLKCLKIEDESTKTDEELWNYMKSRRETFPALFKAYSHLRTRNWVVRCGSQYGVDFVSYRHHPALVHSEYAVLVLLEGEDDNENGRLRVWSDFQGTLRLCGSVAKTLLVLYINKNGVGDVSPLCLDSYSVEERVVARWSAELSREDKTSTEDGTF